MQNYDCANLFYREAMAKISAAEKRLYQQRRDANPAGRAIYLQTNKQTKKETYLHDIETGKRKGIKDLSERKEGSAQAMTRELGEVQTESEERDRVDPTCDPG